MVTLFNSEYGDIAKGVGLNTALQLLLVASLSTTPVTVTTLDGQTVAGELRSLGSKQVVLLGAAEDQTFPLDQLMLVDFHRPALSGNTASKVVRLTDQSVIQFDSIVQAEKNLQVQSRSFESQLLPVSEVQTIRWGAVDEKVSESWEDLASRGARDDLLVFRKGDLLDYVAGSVSHLSEEGVTISVRGRDLTAPLERVFAVVYAKRHEQEKTSLGLLRTTSGDELKVKTISQTEDRIKVALGSGPELEFDLSLIREIDFGGGRIRFLADLPFDDSASVSPNPDFPVVWFTARNFPAGTGGRSPLIIAEKLYPRGLWIHSGAVVRFRLNREFTEFRTTAGFDQTHIGRMPRFNPRIKLVIEGDGSELFAQEFSWEDPPAKLNLNLKNVRELIVRVDSLGVGKGILEHFALGDAQVIK